MAAACTLQLDTDGLVVGLRAVLVGAGDHPRVVTTGEELRGARPSADLWSEWAGRWATVIEGEDIEYRRELATAALRRALTAATHRAEGTP
jgi:hypothetical protein